MSTCGLSHNCKSGSKFKLRLQLEKSLFTVASPLRYAIPKVFMCIILDINYNHFHHLGKSQIHTGAGYNFSGSEPDSRTVWHIYNTDAIWLHQNMLLRKLQTFWTWIHNVVVFVAFHDVTSDKSFNLNLFISYKLYLENVSHKIR